MVKKNSWLFLTSAIGYPLPLEIADVLCGWPHSSVDENGDSSKNRRNRRGIGSSKLKVITNNLANNWRLKSLQSKHERRERRATKTLAVVLGKY